MIPIVQSLSYCRSLPVDETALILARFYMSPPATPRVGLAFKDGVGINNRPDSTFSLLLPRMLVNSTGVCVGREFTLIWNYVFRGLFRKKALPLQGAPTVRRMKVYSAQSGYVYQYFYEGHRDFRTGGETGTEFVFSVSADRKNWHPTSVMLSADAIRGWEAAHERELSSTERYAIAKVALFQAFDERAEPSLMQGEVRVRNADIDGIVETLGL